MRVVLLFCECSCGSERPSTRRLEARSSTYVDTPFVLIRSLPWLRGCFWLGGGTLTRFLPSPRPRLVHLLVNVRPSSSQTASCQVIRLTFAGHQGGARRLLPHPFGQAGRLVRFGCGRVARPRRRAGQGGTTGGGGQSGRVDGASEGIGSLGTCCICLNKKKR